MGRHHIRVILALTNARAKIIMNIKHTHVKTTIKYSLHQLFLNFMYEYMILFRCPTFAQQSDPTCTLQPDPTDPLCCKVPVCTPIPGQTPPPGQTFPPYQTQPPKIFSGGVATPAPTPRTTQRPNVNVRPNVTPTFYPPITRTYRPGETPAPTPYPLPTQPKISTPSPQPTVTQPPIYKSKKQISHFVTSTLWDTVHSLLFMIYQLLWRQVNHKFEWLMNYNFFYI